MLAIITVSCENYTTKHWDGTMTIDVAPGYKVTSATFKDDEIWYFVEPMESSYIPSQKKFVEKSMYGALEGTIIFNETK